MFQWLPKKPCRVKIRLCDNLVVNFTNPCSHLVSHKTVTQDRPSKHICLTSSANVPREIVVAISSLEDRVLHCPPFTHSLGVAVYDGRYRPPNIEHGRMTYLSQAGKAILEVLVLYSCLCVCVCHAGATCLV